MEEHMKLYEYKINANETLYKGIDTETISTKYPKPMWFSQNKNTAKQYGRFVHEFKTIKELKLINITSPYFHSSFVDFLNDFFKHNPSSYDEKMKLLIPIGLPDEISQQNYLESIHVHPISSNQKIYKEVAFLYNRHICSYSKLDFEFVNFLKNIHKQYGFDGYVAPCIWPSKYHVRFSDEICLFNLNEDALLHAGVKTYKQSGGTVSFDIKLSPQAIETFTMESLEYLQKIGWNKPFKLGKDGLLIKPNSYEAAMFYNQKINS
jgi:hypothetical protein